MPPRPDDLLPDDLLPDDLREHLPSAAAQARARAAGLDLEKLRREAPDRYRMLNAEPVVRVSAELAEAAAQLLFEALPGRQVFRVPGSTSERLWAFPPLSDEELLRFDDAAAELVAKPSFAELLAFFRTVRDLRGTQRELMLPTPPERWSGEVALVGPFERSEDAEAWPAGRLPPELIADPLPYRGRWFCDVFASDEALLDGRGEGSS